jgi:hypothetical protein
MKVLVVTPLFPPDHNDSAKYCKELSLQLSNSGHQVEVLAYGKLPESVEGVDINTVNKSLPLPIKLGIFIYKFFIASLRQDRIIINNGPTVELASLFIYPFIVNKSIFLLSDKKATFGLKGIRRISNSFLANNLATINIDTEKYLRPEIHPFRKSDLTEEEFANNWEQHQKEILNYD